MLKLAWHGPRFFYFFFAVIFFLHILFLAMPYRQHQPAQQGNNSPLKVRVLDSEQWRKKSRQIVQSDESNNQTPSSKEAYLSDKDRSFDRQTRARVVDKFRKGIKKAGGQKGSITQKTSKRSKPEMKLSDLGGAISRNDPFERAAKEYTHSKKSTGAGTGAAPGISAATNDYAPDVPLGDLTHLNTVEYKYFGYFLRIKERLEGFWGRSIHEKAQAMAKEGRTLAEDEHITSLKIVMDSEGRIIEIVILGTSGIQELDDAAIESFNQAGPFPHPPKELIVDERVEIEWGFVVNT